MTYILLLFAFLVCAELYAMRKMIERQRDEIESLNHSLNSMSDWIKRLVWDKEEQDEDKQI